MMWPYILKNPCSCSNIWTDFLLNYVKEIFLRQFNYKIVVFFEYVIPLLKNYVEIFETGFELKIYVLITC
jgi:hypothetical protein